MVTGLARVAVLALLVATQAAAQSPAPEINGGTAVPPQAQDVEVQPDQAADAAVAPGADEAGDAGASAKIKALGEGTEQVYVVEHPASWSMHVENVPAATIFALWRAVGGPVVASKAVLDFPFTMSVHEMKAERVVARILQTYNYTLHYDSGRLAQVHVLGAIPERQFKTPRLVESRAQWTNQEMTLLSAHEQAPQPQARRGRPR